jgi:hypothetical protein
MGLNKKSIRSKQSPGPQREAWVSIQSGRLLGQRRQAIQIESILILKQENFGRAQTMQEVLAQLPRSPHTSLTDN